jgi:hypothetical protein
MTTKEAMVRANPNHRFAKYRPNRHAKCPSMKKPKVVPTNA